MYYAAIRYKPHYAFSCPSVCFARAPISKAKGVTSYPSYYYFLVPPVVKIPGVKN